MPVYGKDLEDYYIKVLNLKRSTEYQDKTGCDMLFPDGLRVQVKSYILPSNYVKLDKVHGAIEHLYLSKAMNNYIPLLIGDGTDDNLDVDLVRCELINNGLFIERIFEERFRSIYGNEFIDQFKIECKLVNSYYRTRSYVTPSCKEEIYSILDKYYQNYFDAKLSEKNYIRLGNDILILKSTLIRYLNKEKHYPTIGLWRGFISAEQLRKFDEKSFNRVLKYTPELKELLNTEVELMCLDEILSIYGIKKDWLLSEIYPYKNTEMFLKSDIEALDSKYHLLDIKSGEYMYKSKAIEYLNISPYQFSKLNINPAFTIDSGKLSRSYYKKSLIESLKSDGINRDVLYQMLDECSKCLIHGTEFKDKYKLIELRNRLGMSNLKE